MRAKWQIRAFVDSDLSEIVELSLLAWEPVFESFEQVLGPAIYSILWPDWKKSQAEGVAGACRATDKYHTLVAEIDGRVVGFIAYELKGETGEVVLLAVHPEFQRRGIATQLNQAALDAMRAAGAKLAVAETGGDEGHAPARRAYEKVGYTNLPIVRYFKDL
ncbi:MAG: GNAT family N-acetyltransferase [Candidatus Bipolaricaulis sp.]|nr:GNAT family N-acetyltransferase [Candidatus Bipolaricaulis sp.]